MKRRNFLKVVSSLPFLGTLTLTRFANCHFGGLEKKTIFVFENQGDITYLNDNLAQVKTPLSSKKKKKVC